MRRWDWWRFGWGLALAVLAMTAAPAAATLVVLPKNPVDAIAQADVVFVGKVVSIESAIEGLPAPGQPYSVDTMVLIDVEEVQRGNVGAQVVMREPGGVATSGIQVVDGAPRYEIGSRVLVLANRGQDGFYRTHLLEAGRVTLERSLFALGRMGAQSSPDADDRLNDWKSQLADSALGMPTHKPDPGTDVPPSPKGKMMLRSSRQSMALARFMGGRWESPASIILDQAGDPAVGPLDTVNELVSRSMLTWSSAGNVQMAVAGSGPARGFVCDQGKMLVSFNDPRGEVDDPKGCSGVLAIGGFCADNPPPGSTIGTIRAGALVFNNGWSTQCPEFWTPPFVEEVATHEIGHAIGLAHSAENGQACDAECQDATMYWMAHFDGRRSNLHAYDTAAVAELYGPVAGPTASPAPSASPVPSDSPQATATPTASPLATSSPEPGSTPTPGPSKGCGGGPKTAAATDDMALAFMAVGGIIVTRRLRRSLNRRA